MIKQKRLIPSIFLLSTLLLSACGGGGGTSIQTPSPLEPTRVNSSHWNNTQILSREQTGTMQIELSGSELLIKVTDISVNTGKHIQIYLDTDNNPQTGFHFDNEAWAQSGVDYIIEDGRLFRSTANNSTWSWNTDVGEIGYVRKPNSIEMTIDTSLLQGLCNTFNAGAMSRNKDWDIESFYPASSRMKQFRVSSCANTDDTVPPKITLNGANPMRLPLNTTFNDPGAIATDNVDGDISNKIRATSNVDTSVAGRYFVKYKVSDSSGNSTEEKRTVIIEANAPQGIIIDGNSDDWAAIETLAVTDKGIMKVFDDENKLYILIEATELGVNTQVFLDSDNNAATGFQMGDQAWPGGANFMVENQFFVKAIGNTKLWAWDFENLPAIEFAKNSGIVEMALNKADISPLNNTFSLGFISRDENWDINYLLPENQLSSYLLQDLVVESPVNANDDSATTSEDQPVTIDVLANDLGHGNMSISLVSQAVNGSTLIINNKIVYTPNSSFFGADSFIYTIQDSNGIADSAFVNITVTAQAENNPPDAVEDAPTTFFTQAITIDVLANDTDPDGDTLTVTSITQPPLGQTTLNTDGTILFDPQGNIGSISFSYAISDGRGGTDSTVVTVATSDPNDGNENFPEITGENVTTTLNTPIFIDVLANDTDADGDTLILDQVDAGAHGTTTKVNGGVLYTPDPGFRGTDSFFYGVHDGHGHNGAGQVTVTVTLPSNS